MTDYPHFKIDFLGCNICVILDEDWLMIAEKILNKDLTKDESDVTWNAITFAKDKAYYIAAPNTVKDSTIYHECFHILSEIIDDFELGYSYQNQETQAYLLEYLIEQTLKIKNQKLRTIKKPEKRGTLTKAQVKKAVRDTIEKRGKKK